MRTTIIVLSCVFLMLLIVEQLAGFLLPSAEDVAFFVGLGKDFFGVALAAAALFFFLSGRKREV
jgi:hypothetical protein